MKTCTSQRDCGSRREFLKRSTAAAVGFLLSDSPASTKDALVPAKGPLRVHPTNKRYFTDSSGKAIYLTGSHTWDTFQGWFEGCEYPNKLKAGKPGSFTDYLDVLQKHNHNFIRFWIADTAWSPITRSAIEPQPYVRTGPGKAADGRLQFDLNRFNPAFFDGLRSCAVAARDRGMYISVLLFNCWGISKYPGDISWRYHPFNKANNVNGIDGDPNGDRLGLEYHTLQVPAITKLQEAYVRKVVDTVNDLDNVLYEISNESHAGSKDWQYHLIKFIKNYEAGRPKQHPVLMSGGAVKYDVTNADLFASPADAVAPGIEGAYAVHDLPAATGAKVVILDSDHYVASRSDPPFVWKAFLTGHHPIIMDWWNGGSEWDRIRRVQGLTRLYADKISLATMTPHGELASTKYCLADPGKKYLCYLPTTGAVTIDLTAATGELKSEWMHPVEGDITPGATVAGGAKRTLKAPFPGDAVLYLWKNR